MQQKKTVVSGIQPTGNLHLGNYLGVLKQWLLLQEKPEYLCLFGIMDLHAQTSENSLSKIAFETDQCINTLLAIGIKKETIFVQSGVMEEALPFFWHLVCNTSVGQLNRMTQFKEKSDKGNENLGLYAYPVLMAADILALQADLVPVGEDQRQHLELARDLAKKLNLKIPQPLVSAGSGRIMSLTDPTKKMSKTDPNDNSRINLSDTADIIAKKIKKAVTTEEGWQNLNRIFHACGGQEFLGDILDKSNAAKSKDMLTKAIINELRK